MIEQEFTIMTGKNKTITIQYAGRVMQDDRCSD